RRGFAVARDGRGGNPGEPAAGVAADAAGGHRSPAAQRGGVGSGVLRRDGAGGRAPGAAGGSAAGAERELRAGDVGFPVRVPTAGRGLTAPVGATRSAGLGGGAGGGASRLRR